MLLACLYSSWTPPEGSDEENLWSFAAVTDEPPIGVADAGHDRCTIQLRQESVQACLMPLGRTLKQLDEIPKDKERP